MYHQSRVGVDKTYALVILSSCMAIIHIPIETASGRSVWPEKFPKSELDRRRRVLGSLRYAQEYLCSPVSLFGSKLQMEWLKVYNYDDLERGELGDYEYFFGVDPSVSGRGDYMAICVLAKVIDKGRMYIVDFVREKAGLERMVELLERTASIYPPRVVNVEAVAAQQLLVQSLIERTALPVRSYIPKGNKLDRLTVMATVHFSSSRVKVRGAMDPDKGLTFDPRMGDFIQEWVAYDRGRHDDTLDAVETAIECAAFAGTAASLSMDPIEVDEDDQEVTIENWAEWRRRDIWV